MKQFCITTAMGKRLIGKGVARLPQIQTVLETGTLVIIAGTTNGYVAEEVLTALGQAEGFSRLGFRRGVTVAPGRELPQIEFPGDVVIEKGTWRRAGGTIYDVVDDLKAGDVVVKGANALDPYGQAAVQIGHPQGGTILATTGTGRTSHRVVCSALPKHAKVRPRRRIERMPGRISMRSLLHRRDVR